MKKLTYIYSVLVLLLVMVACQKEQVKPVAQHSDLESVRSSYGDPVPDGECGGEILDPDDKDGEMDEDDEGVLDLDDKDEEMEEDDDLILDPDDKDEEMEQDDDLIDNPNQRTSGGNQN